MSDTILQQLLGDIEISQAQGFSPVRFAYIQSLAQRLERPVYQTNTALADNLKAKAHSFQADFKAASAIATKTLKEITATFPQHQAQASRLYAQGGFQQLERLSKKLAQADALKPENEPSLSCLNQAMERTGGKAKAAEKSPSFDDILSQQEHEITGHLEQKNDSDSLSETRPLELQSMAVFRESMKYFNIDKVIDRAINDHPANPGPHNPHMLAIKSLTQMRDLSPQYCRRFAGYIETLLWLEKNASKLSDTKKVIK